MELYIVWYTNHCSDNEVIYYGDENIIGVFSNELTAYQVGCVEQLRLYNNDRNIDIDIIYIRVLNWLEDNPFPSMAGDLNYWKTYFDLVSDDETIENILLVDRFKDIDFSQVHITKKEMDVF